MKFSSLVLFFLDIRSPSNVKRHVRIELVHAETCRKHYQTIGVNPVRLLP